MSAVIDTEIEQLKAQAEELRKAVRLQAAELLSQPSVEGDLLAENNGSSSPSGLLTLPPSQNNTTGSDITASQRERLSACRRKQVAHNQRNLYRACAGVTMFKARDPDPCAVDGGSVLGIRLELVRNGRFLRPFYVLLNRPWASSPTAPQAAEGGVSHQKSKDKALRIHRHTLPPGIPIAGLAARYLPPPRPLKKGTGTAGRRRHQQDLIRFVRHLRYEVVMLHNRLCTVGDMREAAGVDEPVVHTATSAAAASAITDIHAVDAAATHFAFSWADPRTGTLDISPYGDILDYYVWFPYFGHDEDTENAVFGWCSNLEDLVARLKKRRGTLGVFFPPPWADKTSPR